jgi:CBS domain-containing protein
MTTTMADTSKAAAEPTVGDLMTGDPFTIRADRPLTEAAELMDTYRVSGLPVVDSQGTLVGVISQTDLLHARTTESLWNVWVGLAVRHAMTSPAITVPASLPITRAARLMEDHRIHRLVVTAAPDQRPIGVLSVSDLVHAIAKGLDR